MAEVVLLRIAIVCAAVLAVATNASAWGDKGHEIVAHVAESLLTAEARQARARLLPDSSLAAAAVWPDQMGRRIDDFSPLHYVSIPPKAGGYERQRDCKDRNCVVEAVKSFLRGAGDKSAPENLRRIALRFVAHLVGDLHQPLHAGRRDDRGGTRIPVIFREHRVHLHEFWDATLVELEPGTAEEIAAGLVKPLTAEQRRLWQQGTPEQWTTESFKLAGSHAYRVPESGEISDEYVERARPVVRRRLAQAGVRLAWVLNGVLR